MQEQPPDVQARPGIIRRRRIVLGAIGAAVIVAGILYWAVQPAMPSATAQVLLPTPGADVSAPSTVAEEAVTTSPQVLGRAARSVHPPIGESLLLKRVKVTVIGDDVLSIRVKDPNSADAVALANAVAKAYIAVAPQYFAADLLAQLANSQQQEITNVDRIQLLTQELRVNGTTSATGTIDQGEIQDLETAVSALEANDAVLNGRIAASSPVLLRPAGSV